MSDHSKPRRWTLRIVGNTVAMRRGRLNAAVNGPELFNVPAVPVREDCITEADVEAVARHLAERDHGGPLTGKPICTGYKDEAAVLLAHIFEARQR